MNRLAVYALGLALSFNVTASDSFKNIELNQLIDFKSITETSLEMVSGKVMQNTPFSPSISSELNEREDLVAQISVYGLIIFIYSLYWFRVKE